MGREVKRKVRFPKARPYKDRHGRKRWRYRKGSFSRELGTDYGSEEFRDRYAAAEQELDSARREGAGAERSQPRSVGALVASWYKSPAFRNLAEPTKRAYRSPVEPWRAKHADKPVDRFERRHAMEALAEKADTPGAANNLRKRLIQIFDHAVALDWIKSNPARQTKPYKLEGEGFHTWDEGEIARFFEIHEPGTMAHLAVTLMLYTGASRADAVRLGWPNVRHVENVPRLEYRRQKTRRSGGVLVSIPIHPDLWAIISAIPKDRSFLATAYGKGRSPDGLGNKVREWCDNAGLRECSAHGLRKACARRLAEAGATAHEIMAITGHKTLALVQRYTEAALREGLADSAMQKLLSRPNREQTVVNLPHRFTTNSDKIMKGNGKS